MFTGGGEVLILAAAMLAQASPPQQNAGTDEMAALLQQGLDLAVALRANPTKVEPLLGDLQVHMSRVTDGNILGIVFSVAHQGRPAEMFVNVVGSSETNGGGEPQLCDAAVVLPGETGAQFFSATRDFKKVVDTKFRLCQGVDVHIRDTVPPSAFWTSPGRALTRMADILKFFSEQHLTGRLADFASVAAEKWRLELIGETAPLDDAAKRTTLKLFDRVFPVEVLAPTLPFSTAGRTALHDLFTTTVVLRRKLKVLAPEVGVNLARDEKLLAQFSDPSDPSEETNPLLQEGLDLAVAMRVTPPRMERIPGPTDIWTQRISDSSFVFSVAHTGEAAELFLNAVLGPKNGKRTFCDAVVVLPSEKAAEFFSATRNFKRKVDSTFIDCLGPFVSIDGTPPSVFWTSPTRALTRMADLLRFFASNHLSERLADFVSVAAEKWRLELIGETAPLHDAETRDLLKLFDQAFPVEVLVPTPPISTTGRKALHDLFATTVFLRRKLKVLAPEVGVNIARDEKLLAQFSDPR